MSIPARLLNVTVLRIERPTRGRGFSAEDPQAIVVAGPLPATRQGGTTEFIATPSRREEVADGVFYLDPTTPNVTAVRVNDRVVWQRSADDAESLSEVVDVQVWDGFPGGRLAHLRLLTRGGDGGGA